MIPPFEENGCLPPGIHPATLAEIESRFGCASKIRRAQMESLHWMVDLAKRAKVKRVILNGSFVTDIMEPNDVDCVLFAGSDKGRDRSAEAQLQEGLPFVQVALVRSRDFKRLTTMYFATDRFGTPKGMIEVAPWI